MKKIEKNIILFALVIACYPLQSLSNPAQDTQPPTVIIREPQGSKIRRVIMSFAAITGSAMFVDAKFFEGRWLWRPLKKRLFSDLYKTVNENNTLIQENGNRLGDLSEQTTRIEKRVNENNELIQNNGKQLTSLSKQITQSYNSISRIANEITRLDDQTQKNSNTLDEHGNKLDKLLKGQKEILQQVQPQGSLTERVTGSTINNVKLITSISIPWKNFADGPPRAKPR